MFLGRFLDKNSDIFFIFLCKLRMMIWKIQMGRYLQITSKFPIRKYCKKPLFTITEYCNIDIFLTVKSWKVTLLLTFILLSTYSRTLTRGLKLKIEYNRMITKMYLIINKNSSNYYYHQVGRYLFC